MSQIGHLVKISPQVLHYCSSIPIHHFKYCKFKMDLAVVLKLVRRRGYSYMIAILRFEVFHNRRTSGIPVNPIHRFQPSSGAGPIEKGEQEAEAGRRRRRQQRLSAFHKLQHRRRRSRRTLGRRGQLRLEDVQDFRRDHWHRHRERGWKQHGEPWSRV